MRYLLFLLLGIGLLVVGRWALEYLITPVFFRPGAAPLVLTVVLAAIAVFVLRGRQAR